MNISARIPVFESPLVFINLFLQVGEKPSVCHQMIAVSQDLHYCNRIWSRVGLSGEYRPPRFTNRKTGSGKVRRCPELHAAGVRATVLLPAQPWAPGGEREHDKDGHHQPPGRGSGQQRSLAIMEMLL